MMRYKFIKIFVVAILLGSLQSSFAVDDSKYLQSSASAIRQSRNYLFENKPKEAIKLLQSAYAKYGESREISEALAYAFSKDNQYSSAAIYFEKAFSLSNNNIMLLLSAGRSYEKCNAIDSAISAYNRYLKIKPQDAIVWKYLAQLLAKKNNHKQAIDSYMNYLSYSKSAANTIEACEIAYLYLYDKNYPQAKAWFDAALGACVPENIELRSKILSGLMDIAIAENNSKELERYYFVLNSINPAIVEAKYPQIKEEIITAELRAKEAQAAEKLAQEEALKAQEQARILAEEKAQEEARKAQEEKLKLEAQAKAEADKLAQEQEAKQLIAQAEVDKANAAQAEESAPILALLDPQSQVKKTEAKAQDSTLIKEEQAPVEEDKLSQMQVCENFLNAGELSNAENLIHEIIAQNPKSSQAWVLLAKIYQAQDMTIDAYLAAKQALAKDKDSLDALLVKLQTSALVEDKASFLESLIEAAKANPDCPEILLAAARMSAYMANKDEAIRCYDIFLSSTLSAHPLYAIAQDERDAYETARNSSISLKGIIKDLKVNSVELENLQENEQENTDILE